MILVEVVGFYLYEKMLSAYFEASADSGLIVVIYMRVYESF